MADEETIAVYNAQSDSYATLVKTETTDPSVLGFIQCITPAGFVLDLGCGPAQASAIMRNHGLRVDPVDASAEMVQMANTTFDIGARQAEFTDIDGSDIYDGIWANFSLLHATRDDFPGLLARLARSLKTGGVIHLGMKTGEGSNRDRLGRFYSYYSEDELRQYLQDLDFAIDHTNRGEGRGLAGSIDPWVTMRGTLQHAGTF